MGAGRLGGSGLALRGFRGGLGLSESPAGAPERPLCIRCLTPYSGASGREWGLAGKPEVRANLPPADSYSLAGSLTPLIPTSQLSVFFGLLS